MGTDRIEVIHGGDELPEILTVVVACSRKGPSLESWDGLWQW